ncbi:MAG: sulfite exporter TauE/SafE family protein, partial [Candidatus Acidiferrum sp.]
IGMFLEIATTLGALVGAYLATRLHTSIIGIIFGGVLLFSAYFSSREPDQHGAEEAPDPLAHRLKLEGCYPTPKGEQEYRARRVPLGFGMMFGAGTLSGLLGIGSGAMKVLAMDQAMRLPFKVSTTTSNFMIGVTAAASAGIYLSRGFIDPGLAMPVMLGVLAGSMLGARILVKAHSRYVRLVFSLVIVALGIEMIFNSIKGRM